MPRQTFIIYPLHQDTIRSLAKHSGDCSESAALRSIIDRFAKAGKTLYAQRQGRISEEKALEELGALFLL